MKDDIKSALEIAQEKVEKLGEATEEERLKWKYVPEGERLAARYLKENVNLIAELTHYEEPVRKYVKAGAAQVLTRNLSLPKNEAAKNTNKRAMEGLRLVKTDRAALENVYSQIRRLFDHYAGQGEQQRKQAHQALKADFEAKAQRAVQQQLSPLMATKIDVERLPEFQIELRKLNSELDSQYLVHLNDYKRKLLEMA
jgi:hypothetical protein